jgi:NAD(P)-dependent dehydrogenase (short-subunit alcohol dehydrogenase family)
MSLLKDKVAIVTGGASGIGASTAILFAEQGAKVVITDVNEELGRSVAAQIKESGNEAIFLKADAGSAEDAEKTVQLAVDTFGKLNIAVNNAGIAGHMGPISDFPIDAWQKVIDINLSGVFYGLKYQIAAIEKTAASGSIINVSSIMGAVATPYAAAYVASKHALLGLTKVAALESSAKGIRVNAVGPAYIETPILSAVSEEQMKAAIGLHPIGRLGKPEEVAELFLWLASDKSSFVTGSYYPIDGGYLAL